MTRYTPPSEDGDEIATSFRRRPLWMQVAVILCLVGTIFLALGNVVFLLFD